MGKNGSREKESGVMEGKKLKINGGNKVRGEESWDGKVKDMFPSFHLEHVA